LGCNGDHLGNVRLSYTDNNNDGVIQTDGINSEIVEESNYYPFGLKHKGYNNVTNSLGNSTAQKFGYNGIELNESLGLNLMEMDLRQYDPAIARWTSIDPVVHHSMSTYTAFDNNPVFWADPSGADSENNWLQDLFDNTASGTTLYNDGNGGFTETNPADGNCCGGKKWKDMTAAERQKAAKNMNAGELQALAYSMPVGGYGAAMRGGDAWNPSKEDIAEAEAAPGQLAMLISGEYALAKLFQGAAWLYRATLGARLVKSGVQMTKVGRWMTKAEYEIMKKSGQMIEGAGGQTFVSTGGSSSFKAASKGSVYVEFEVAANSLLQGGKQGWYKALGPTAGKAMQSKLAKQGGQILPSVQNISNILKIK
jgi:RHS repeat-associated protein